MTNTLTVQNTLLQHVKVFKEHTHPVVNVLLLGFSRILMKRAFASPARRDTTQAVHDSIRLNATQGV